MFCLFLTRLFFPSSQLFQFSFGSYDLFQSILSATVEHVVLNLLMVMSAVLLQVISFLGGFCKFLLQAPFKLGLLFPCKSRTPLWLNFAFTFAWASGDP